MTQEVNEMSENKSRTGISSITPGEIRIRGYNIVELMGRKSFAEVAYLVLKGQLPTDAEGKMMDAILTSSVDHGVTPPSSLAARTVISGGNPLNAAVAGGILTIGDTHGGAIEQCARLLQNYAPKIGEPSEVAAELLADLKTQKMRMPGFGHRLHKTDPRTVRLFGMADELMFSGNHQTLAKAIETMFKEQGKSLPINVDGAIAAVISDMDFDWRLGKGFFIISRTVGLIAHANEELAREKPMRELGISDYIYDGPPPQKLED
ncbi:MAG: citryl-CoA lyase [Candidatus Zixiibacteriota bacterium]|nr:MAG: citryl-CoA lyase [candidate division Zixibacteria bacterium]